MLFYPDPQKVEAYLSQWPWHRWQVTASPKGVDEMGDTIMEYRASFVSPQGDGEAFAYVSGCCRFWLDTTTEALAKHLLQLRDVGVKVMKEDEARRN